MSSQYGNASGNVRWLLNASVGQRGELKTKSKSEQGFVAATGVRNSWKDEFEDERVTTNTLDFAPRLNIKLAGGDELVFTPWITPSDERKTKAVDKFKYNTPATGSGYVGDGRRTEDEDKLRETARLRGEWKHKLDGGQLAFYAAAQQGGEEKDKTALEYNAAGALTKTTLEEDDKDEREWYAGAKFERKLGQHRFSSGLEYKDKSRNDVKTKLENGVPKSAGRGDNFDIEERRWTAISPATSKRPLPQLSIDNHSHYCYIVIVSQPGDFTCTSVFATVSPIPTSAGWCGPKACAPCAN